jgi:predicted dehydrogenase
MENGFEPVSMNNNQQKSVRVGLIGSGSVACRIHLPGLRLCPGVEITGVASVDDDAEEKTGVKRIYRSYRQLLEQPEIDAVVIATPNHLHREMALAALAAGKHVLCEKPLALNAVEGAEMLAAAQKSGLVHMTAFTYRYAPSVRYLRQLVDRGELGVIRVVRASYLMALSTHLLGWRSSKEFAGSGVLADIGSHLIHLVQWLAGDIASLTAKSRDFRDGVASDVEDWIAFLAEFSSGARGTFEISRVCPGRGADITENMRIELYGSSGAAVFSLQDPWGLQVSIGEAAREPARLLERVEVPESYLKLAGAPRNPREGENRWTYRYDQAFQFIESVRRVEIEPPSFEDGLRCQKVLDAALASSQTGKWTAIS